jgi:hypothetical protein
MNNEPEKRLISAAEAESLLNNGEQIHTFTNPGGMLLGCDMSRQSVLDKFKEYDGQIEIAGPMARKMKHALVIWRDNGPLFIENDPVKLDQFDPL